MPLGNQGEITSWFSSLSFIPLEAPFAIFCFIKLKIYLEAVSKIEIQTIKMKIEKYTTVKAQTTAIKIRTIPKRKRTSLRENIETKRTKSLEGLEGIPNVTKDEIKHILPSKQLEFDIEGAQEDSERIKTDARSGSDMALDIAKRCQALLKK